MQSCCRVNAKLAIQVQFLEHSTAYKRGREELQPPNIHVYQFFLFLFTYFFMFLKKHSEYNIRI